jgi:hypothetical protein
VQTAHYLKLVTRARARERLLYPRLDRGAFDAVDARPLTGRPCDRQAKHREDVTARKVAKHRGIRQPPAEVNLIVSEG